MSFICDIIVKRRSSVISLSSAQRPDEHHECVVRHPDSRPAQERRVGRGEDAVGVEGECPALLSTHALPLRRVHALSAQVRALVIPEILVGSCSTRGLNTEETFCKLFSGLTRMELVTKGLTV